MKHIYTLFEKFITTVDNKSNTLTEPDTRIRQKVITYLKLNEITDVILPIWEEAAKINLYPLLITPKNMSYIFNDIKIEINIENKEILTYKNDTLLTFKKLSLDTFKEIIEN